MIAIIDYNAGNLTSVARALAHIGWSSIITDDPKKIRQSDRIIFPGVGAAGAAMESLKRSGLDMAIRNAFRDGKPILGICLGTQIIMGYSEENQTTCLGVVEGVTRQFPPGLKSENGSALKIPHMGWNRVKNRTAHRVMSGLQEIDEFYFVHGYYPDPDNFAHVIGTTDYGICFASIIGFKNILATQFHLEKSGRPGLLMLEYFCKWTPC